MFSTKNLYLCVLRYVTSITYDKISQTKILHYSDELIYVIARKEDYEYFDIFNKSNYLVYGDVFTSLVWCVCDTKPFLTYRKYVNKKVLIEILRELNPQFLESKRKKFNKKL